MKPILFLLILISLCKAEKNYFLEAAKYYKVPPQLLWAIAKKESKFNPNAKNKNKNGTYDIGLMQINTIHAKELWDKYKISQKDLYNPKLNIFVGAMILEKCLKKHKNNLQNGITCYNGRIRNNPYGKEVLALLSKQLEINNKGN